MSLPNELLPVGLLGSTSAGGALSTYSIERSVRFNPSDSAYLSRTPTVAGNRKTWTWAGWVKRSTVTNADLDCFFACVPSASDYVQLAFQPGTNYLGLYIANPSNVAQSFSLNVYRDLSAWYHIVVAFDSTQATITNRLKVYVNGIEIAYSTDARIYITQNTDFAVNSVYQHTISGIVPYSSTRYFSGYLADIHFIDGQALDPTSFGEFDANGIWQPIAYSGSYGTNGFHLPFDDNSTAAALGTDTSGNGNTWTVNNLSVSQQSLSVSSYSNVSEVLIGGVSQTVNTTSLTSLVRSSIFQNRVRDATDLLTLSGTPGSSVTINYSGFTGITLIAIRLQRVSAIDASFSVTGVITGTGSVSSSTTEFIYNTTAVSGSFTIQTTNSSNGMQVQDISYIGASYDSNGGANIDSLVDVPTNGTETDTGVGGEVRGNYATWNPLDQSIFSGSVVLLQGNLQYSGSSSSAGVKGTIFVDSGKWYWECVLDFEKIGALTGIGKQNAVYYPGYSSSSYAYSSDGTKVNNSASASYGASYEVGDVVGVALDLDAGTLEFYKNGVSQGTAFSSLSGSFAAHTGDSGTSGGTTWTVNFGQRPFAYTAPSGFKALCTANLSAPVVTKPSEYFDVVTYAGSSSPITISGLAFSPDLVWSKNRSASNRHGLIDSVRGVNLSLASNLTNAELLSQTDLLTSFTSDGYTIGVDAGQYGWNWNGQSFVNWAWDAGSSTVSNTDGSITSSVRANPSAGFSVVSYSGTISGSAPSPLPTVGHGLGIAPQLVIGKSRNNGGAESGNWFVWHASAGTGNWLRLNTTGAAGSISGNGGGTMVAPTSTVFSTPFISGSNISGNNYIAYCFAPVDGYSSFGSYTGNGSADGPFVFTNHHPRWILLKRTDTTSNWTIIDTAREGYNVDNDPLYPNLTNVEGTTDLADILSNGFKFRSADASVNANAGTYIYASFAEQPFQYSRAR